MVNDIQRKIQLLIEMAGAFNKEYHELVLRRLVKSVKSMTVEELEYAIDKVIVENVFAPTIAELWKIIGIKRTEEKFVLCNKVMTWLHKNTDWDYSQHAVQCDIDTALIALGKKAGSVTTDDI